MLEKILKSDTPTNLEGERRKVTIFFSDIRSFTKISEQLAPEKVVSLLNQYFEKMIEIIFAHSGTLDKFIGDGLMVEFGAPLEDKEQERHAVRAAIHMQYELYKLAKKWLDEGYPEIIVGMGVHTGFAVVGNIGSDVRMEYTAVGDAVNVAARLEKSTKKLNKSIIISEDTYNAVKQYDEFKFEDLGEIELSGREKFIKAYAVTEDFSKEYNGPAKDEVQQASKTKPPKTEDNNQATPENQQQDNKQPPIENSNPPSTENPKEQQQDNKQAENDEKKQDNSPNPEKKGDESNNNE